METLCKWLRAFPWVVWVITALAFCLVLSGLGRLSMGPTLEHVFNAVRFGSLTLGLVLLKSVAYPSSSPEGFWSPKRQGVRLGLALLCLGVLVCVTLAAWPLRV